VAKKSSKKATSTSCDNFLSAARQPASGQRVSSFSHSFPSSIAMKKLVFTLILAAVALRAFSQEQATYNHYPIFPILINPGYTGFENQHQFLGNYRNMWTGFPGAPQNFTAMYHGPVGDKLGLGGGIFSEKAGDLNLFRIQGNYAFRFQAGKTQIGLGLTTEFLTKQIDNALLSNPLVDQNDTDLESMTNGESYFDASVGAHILYDQKLFFDLTLPNTVRARLDEVPVDEEEDTNGLLAYYIMQMGYIFNMENQGFKVIPSITLRDIRDVPFQVDINLQGRFLEEKLITGLTYRPSTGGSLAFMLGTKISKVTALYSYDVSFNEFQPYSGGGHEITLSLNLNRKSSTPAK
jgi:type IX secretion system PorP/SprF family membrane protein